ncbi:MAG: hypothetical protein IT432_00695 [Phycisphaerales bacterium]|nr:hypothetical protein [Phycisphaerales bacterium]
MSHGTPRQPAFTDPAQTRRVAALADRRTIRARAISLAGRWLSSAAIVALAMVLVWKFMPAPWIRAFDWWWLIAAPMVLAVIPAAIALARPVQSRRGAMTLDENLSLKDRLTSAIDLHDRPPPGVDAGFAELAVRRAEELAREVRPQSAVPLRVDRAWGVWPSLVVLAIGAGVLVRTRPPATIVVPPVSKEEVKQAGEQVRAAAKVIESIKSEPTLATPDVQRQLEAIADVERELAAGQTLPADARTQSAKALERLAQSLKDNADRELANHDALRDSLLDAARVTKPDAGESDTSELAKALKRGDLAAAEEAARQIVEQMPSMSADERAALAKELRDLSSQMARQDAKSGDADQKSTASAEQSATSDSDRERDTPGEDNDEPSKNDAKPGEANPGEAKPEGRQTDAPEAAESKQDQGTRDAQNPAPTSGQSTPPGERPPGDKKPDAKPDESAKSTPPSETANEKPESKSANADQNNPQEKPASPEKSRSSSAEQRKEQLRRAMEDAARDLSKPDKPRDANQREGDSDRPSGQPGEESRESKPGEPQQQSTRDGTTTQQDQSKPGDQPGEAKHEQSEKQVDRQGEQGQGKPEQGKSEQGKSDQGKPAPTSDDKAQGAEQKNQQQGDRQPSTAPGQSPRPDAGGEKSPTTQKNGGERNDQKQEGAKPDTGKPDSQPNGEKSPRPDAPGLQKLADTLREAEEAQKNASRDSKLADRLREQAMKTLENASPEQIEKAAEAARDLAKRAPTPDSNSVSPDVAKKMLDQAEQLMKNATPEQKQKLQDMARKMAEGMPDNNHNKDGGGDQQSQDATRRAAEEFMKNASPEDKKKLSDLAKSLGLDRPGNRGQGNQPGEGPGRERGDPREFGNAETKTIDMRDRTNRQTPSQNDRVISDWFDPTGKPSDRATSGRSATGAEVVRRAVQGAERSIEQQVVPPQQGEYVRRVFRRYLQRTQGATPTQSAPSSAPATPDAPDAPRK